MLRPDVAQLPDIAQLRDRVSAVRSVHGKLVKNLPNLLLLPSLLQLLLLLLLHGRGGDVVGGVSRLGEESARCDDKGRKIQLAEDVSPGQDWLETHW